MAKKYNIIYADPPWAYRNMGNIQATAQAQYNTMNNEDICNLPVQKYVKIIVYYSCGLHSQKYKKH